MAAPNGEKTPLASKKFIAMLIAEIGFFALMGMMLWLHEVGSLLESTAFIALAIICGFIVVGYCLGQSYVDKFVRVAEITMGRAKPEPTPEPSDDEEA